MILGLIRSHLADGVVYQSKFAKEWWERVRGRLPRPTWVVYNGVDLNLFTPSGPNKRPDDYCRLLLVEGRLGGGYEIGLEMAVRLAERLAQSLEKESRQRVELIIVGRVDKKTSEHWRREAHIPIHFAGEVAQSNIPEIDRSAHLLYSADLNAACPNSVIEALACGLPVISFDTGAIPELVGYDAGKVVPYGGNPWRLDPPDLDALSQAALAVMLEYGKYRQGARNQAEALFSLDKMVEGYLQALQEG
jgi:glycosyltransferase involved in cell wall biosynthesis